MGECLNEKAGSRNSEERTAVELIEDGVFKNIFIPRALNEVSKPEVEIKRIVEAPYESVTGTRKTYSPTSSSESGGSSDEEDDSIKDPSRGRENSKSIKHLRPKDESPNSRKERKKAFRDSKAEKRKDKIKKHVKKRKEKATGK